MLVLTLFPERFNVTFCYSAFGREKTEEERFDEANKKLTGTQLFTNRIMTFMMPGMIVYHVPAVTILITWVSVQKN